MHSAKIVAIIAVLAASVPLISAEGSSVTFYTDAAEEWCVFSGKS